MFRVPRGAHSTKERQLKEDRHLLGTSGKLRAIYLTNPRCVMAELGRVKRREVNEPYGARGPGTKVWG